VGLTLTEVLAVLSIISMLATLAAPSLQSFIRQLQIRSCLRQSSQLFRQAQTSAGGTYLPHRILLRNNGLFLQINQQKTWLDTPFKFTPAQGIRFSLNQTPSRAIVPLCTLRVYQPLARRSYCLTISAGGRIRIQKDQ
jgi:prepilin-type N-terminal cleavage/methylation domain-containing protein